MKFPVFFLYVFSLIFHMHWINGMSQGPELQRAHTFCCALFNISLFCVQVFRRHQEYADARY